MVLYLTSSFIPYQEPGEYKKTPPEDCYGFFDDLKKEWPDSANVLFVPADPTLTKDNENQIQQVIDAFEYKDLKVAEVKTLDDNCNDALKGLIVWSDVIYMGGGHAPTQLAFMKRIGLKDALTDYPGIIIGLSAGSINAAYDVYLMPELEGEAADPNYVRFSEGLDLTNIELIPHADYLKTVTLDGKKLIDDMATPVDKDFRNFEAKDMQDVKDMSDRQTAFCNRLWNAIDAFCKKQPLSAAGKAILLQAINDYGMNNTRCHGTTAGWSSNTG